MWVTAHGGGSTQLIAHTPCLTLPAVLPREGPILLCLVDFLLQDLRGRTTGLCSEDWGPPCAELWSGPMSRRLEELAKVGKAYDIRLNVLLGGLVLIVWCIPTQQMVQFNT